MTMTLAAPRLAFPVEEYQRRRRAVRDEMRARGMDLLYITSPTNLLYLTGYQAIWYPPRLPVGAVIDRDSDEVLLFDWSRHVDYVASAVLCDGMVAMEYGSAARTVADTFVARGWIRRVVGLERSSCTPSAAVAMALADALRGAGAWVADGDWIVDDIRLYKSPEELDRLGRASAIADSAMRQLWQELKPGITAMQVSANLTRLLADRGSEHAAMPVLVNAGPRACVDIHGFPSQRPLQRGDVVVVDCCAVLDRYHVNLARSFLMGGGDHPARRLLDDVAGAVLELQRAARPGDGPEIALAAAERHVLDRVAPEKIWWIGGYSLGLGLPPSWVGHAYLANGGHRKNLWQAGYVSNFETVLVDPAAGFSAEIIDTVVMGRSGLEILSSLPRGLLDAAV